MSDAKDIRNALKLIPLLAAKQATDTPDLRSIYTPSSHEGALDPSREIVVGDRGVGKSFWSSVLTDTTARTAIGPIYKKIGLQNTAVKLGFSEVAARDEYPSPRTLKSLVAITSPEAIWHSVIINSFPGPYKPKGWKDWSWEERAKWVEASSEQSEQFTAKFNAALRSSRKRHLVLFDALDRLGSDWEAIRVLTRALLIDTLEMRSYSNIHLKLFMRPDMYEDKEIWAIRDGSKLRQNRVALTWQNNDLYGFLWHWLATADDPGIRRVFSRIVKATAGIQLPRLRGENLMVLNSALVEDSDIQSRIFTQIAGQFMGADKRKGFTYTWIPNHLSDAKGRVSLRSFMIAIREAAKATPSAANTAITPEAIKAGVRAASLNRIEQLTEDYPWIKDVLAPLEGLQTPNTPKAFIERWIADNTVKKLFEERATSSGYLIPVQLEGVTANDSTVYERLIDALMNINVLERRGDGRINMPDLFQVAAGLLRKGGVRPAQ
jgi:hypothetical protein